MSAPKIVARGYVIVRAGGKVSAVVSRAQAEEMKRKYGGRIANAKGRPYRMAQGTLRVLTDTEGL